MELKKIFPGEWEITNLDTITNKVGDGILRWCRKTGQ